MSNDKMPNEIALTDLINVSGAFYGIDNHSFKIDGTVYTVLEDEQDGYRSSLDYVKFGFPQSSDTFFNTALDVVKIVQEPKKYDWTEDELYSIVSISDNHVWLIFGTAYYDEYYPCFIFKYTPRSKLLKKDSFKEITQVIDDPIITCPQCNVSLFSHAVINFNQEFKCPNCEKLICLMCTKHYTKYMWRVRDDG